MFWGVEGILICKTLKYFRASQVTYSAILFINLNKIAIIVNSEVAVQRFKNNL